MPDNPCADLVAEYADAAGDPGFWSLVLLAATLLIAALLFGAR